MRLLIPNYKEISNYTPPSLRWCCGSILYSIPSSRPGQFIVSIHIAPTGTFVHIINVFEDYISQIMFHQSSALQSGFVPKEEVADDGTEKERRGSWSLLPVVLY